MFIIQGVPFWMKFGIIAKWKGKNIYIHCQEYKVFGEKETFKLSFSLVWVNTFATQSHVFCNIIIRFLALIKDLMASSLLNWKVLWTRNTVNVDFVLDLKFLKMYIRTCTCIIKNCIFWQLILYINTYTWYLFPLVYLFAF